MHFINYSPSTGSGNVIYPPPLVAEALESVTPTISSASSSKDNSVKQNFVRRRIEYIFNIKKAHTTEVVQAFGLNMRMRVIIL